MHAEYENEQIKQESNVVYTNGISCRLRNQKTSCVFNSVFQVLSCCDILMEWIVHYRSADVQLENASYKEIFGWRSLRILEDVRAMQLNQLIGREQLNVHTARFSFPSCWRTVPSVMSWVSEKYGISWDREHSVNWVDGDVVYPTEFLRSTQEEAWTKRIVIGQGKYQYIVAVIQSMFESIYGMEEHDASRKIRRMEEPHLTGFPALACGVVRFRRTCSNRQCTVNVDGTRMWSVFELPIFGDTSLGIAIQQGFANWSFGDGLDCQDCLTENGKQILDVSFEFPPVLAIDLKILKYKATYENNLMEYLLWQDLNHPLYLANGPRNCPDNEKQWLTYRLCGVLAGKFWQDGGGHLTAYVNRSMEGRGPTWIHCDDERIVLLRPDELAHHSANRNRPGLLREIPSTLVFELVQPKGH